MYLLFFKKTHTSKNLIFEVCVLVKFVRRFSENYTIYGVNLLLYRCYFFSKYFVVEYPSFLLQVTCPPHLERGYSVSK